MFSVDASKLSAEHPILVAGTGVVGLLCAVERLGSRIALPNCDVVKSASVRWGRAKHVLEIEVNLSSPIEQQHQYLQRHRHYRSSHGNDFKLNVYGSGIPAVASMFLPLTLNSPFMDISFKDSTTIILGLGAKTKQTTILEQLKQRLVGANKPVVIELLRGSSNSINDISVCAACLSPKALYECLEAGAKKEPKEEDATSVILPTLPVSAPGVSASLACRPRERTTSGILCRFSMCPLLSAGVAFSTLSNMLTSYLLKWFPGFPSFGFLSGAASLKSVLPPMPTSYLQAFDLGVIAGKVRQFAPGTAEHNSALAEATKLMGRVVSAAEIDAIRNELVKVLTHRSIAQRVMGFFSFVNLMWFGAICGITLSVGPVLWLVTKPLRAWFATILQRVAKIIKEVVVWLLEKVITPIVTRLHQSGVFEVMIHLAALTLYLHALRAPEGAAGTYIAMSGIVALLGATGYSITVVKPQTALDKLPARYMALLTKVVIPLYPAAFCVPAAIAHQSLLHGFAAVTSLLAALGFGVAAYPFCYCVGWDSKDDMVRTTAACGIGLATFIGLRLFQVDSYYLKPFVAPVSVMGGMGHYLGLLICSNAWSCRRGKNAYSKYNIAMVGSLLASIFAGNMMGMEGLKNTAITFGVLWVVDKIRELQDYARLNAWFLLFGGSIAAYYTALWLHAHPAFVVSMFTALDS